MKFRFLLGGVLACASVFPGLSRAEELPQLTAEERAKWFVNRTYGPQSLFVGGIVSSAIGTANNSPEEYGPGWSGFGKRYGMRLVNNTVTNGIEGSLGAAWNEDPRYRRVGSGPMKQRFTATWKQVFFARKADRDEQCFAWARLAGISGGAFAQNLWMPDSTASSGDAAVRIGTGYLGRIVGNSFREFGPDLKKKLLRR